MTPCSLCFLFALSSSLCASAGGLSALLLSAALSLLFLPALSFRTVKKTVPLRLLAAISFVLRLNALFSVLALSQPGWRAVLLSVAAVLTVALQLGGTDERAFRPAIPLLFAALTFCLAPMVGGTPMSPAWISEPPTSDFALLSALICPVSSALILPRFPKKCPHRIGLFFFAALGCAAALPSVFFRGVFGAEACALVAAPFCAALELRTVFCTPAFPAYTANKNAKGTPCCSPKNAPPQTDSPCQTPSAKKHSPTKPDARS